MIHFSLCVSLEDLISSPPFFIFFSFAHGLRLRWEELGIVICIRREVHLHFLIMIFFWLGLRRWWISISCFPYTLLYILSCWIFLHLGINHLASFHVWSTLHYYLGITTVCGITGKRWDVCRLEVLIYWLVIMGVTGKGLICCLLTKGMKGWGGGHTFLDTYLRSTPRAAICSIYSQSCTQLGDIPPRVKRPFVYVLKTHRLDRR